MSDRLSSCVSDIDANVVPVRPAFCLDARAHGRHQRPDRSVFPGRQRQEVRFVPPRNDEAVAGTDRKRVEKRNRQVILREEASGTDAVAEDARHRLGAAYYARRTTRRQ